MNFSFKGLALGALLLALGGCSTVPITKRKSLNLVSDATILQMSQMQYANFVNQARGKGTIVQNPRVMGIADRLIRATNAYMRENDMASLLSTMSWEVNVVQSKQVNAFCMPGGKIVVYTGIVDLLGRVSPQTDAELAAILGHEIAHALARHSAERLSNAKLQNLGGQILGTVVGIKAPGLSDIFSAAYGLGTQLFVALPFGRKQELEADKMGLVLMALAGYDPRHAITLWQKMGNHSGGNRNEFLSTHPSEANRIKAIEAYLPTAQQYLRSVQQLPAVERTIPASRISVPRKR